MDLIDRSERHDEGRDKEIGNGQAQDEVVGHRLEVAVNQYSSNNKYISLNRENIPNIVCVVVSLSIYLSIYLPIYLSVFLAFFLFTVDL